MDAIFEHATGNDAISPLKTPDAFFVFHFVLAITSVVISRSVFK